MNTTLTKLHQWATMVLTDGAETAMACVPGARDSTGVLELVSRITDSLMPQGGLADRDVLRKSIEETLFLCVGPDPLLSQPEFDARFTHFLRGHGIPALLQLLLSLYLFNMVCLRTEKSFRILAGTENSFHRYMEQAEHACRRIVRAAWMSEDVKSPSSANPIPENLLAAIEARLWDVTSTN